MFDKYLIAKGSEYEHYEISPSKVKIINMRFDLSIQELASNSQLSPRSNPFDLIP